MTPNASDILDDEDTTNLDLARSQTSEGVPTGVQDEIRELTGMELALQGANAALDEYLQLNDAITDHASAEIISKEEIGKLIQTEPALESILPSLSSYTAVPTKTNVSETQFALKAYTQERMAEVETALSAFGKKDADRLVSSYAQFMETIFAEVFENAERLQHRALEDLKLTQSTNAFIFLPNAEGGQVKDYRTTHFGSLPPSAPNTREITEFRPTTFIEFYSFLQRPAFFFFERAAIPDDDRFHDFHYQGVMGLLARGSASTALTSGKAYFDPLMASVAQTFQDEKTPGIPASPEAKPILAELTLAVRAFARFIAFVSALKSFLAAAAMMMDSYMQHYEQEMAKRSVSEK